MGAPWRSSFASARIFIVYQRNAVMRQGRALGADVGVLFGEKSRMRSGGRKRGRKGEGGRQMFLQVREHCCNRQHMWDPVRLGPPALAPLWWWCLW